MQKMHCIPWSGRSPGEGNGYSLQYSCLGNPMDRKAWQATVYRITKSKTWLSNFHSNVSHLILRARVKWKKIKVCPHRAYILGERIWRKMVHLIDKLSTRYFRQYQNNKTVNIWLWSLIFCFQTQLHCLPPFQLLYGQFPQLQNAEDAVDSVSFLELSED